MGSPVAGVAHHDVRDSQALARFELFLGTAVATVLVVRSALAATGYPQVGGNGLHVAHVLYGGLLMGVAIAIVEIVPGTRARRYAAFIGGIGFGLFIDEVGKFLTKDVNYFFRPAVAIIYAVFVIFYVAVRELVLRRPLTARRRVAIAAVAAGDLALGQLDSAGQAHALEMLDGLEATPLATAIRGCLTNDDSGQIRAQTPLTRLRERALSAAKVAVEHPAFVPGLKVLFGLQVLGMVGQLLLVVLRPDIGLGKGSDVTDLGTEVSTAVSAAYALWGGILMQRGDVPGALRVLYRSALVTLLFTQVFVFVRYQWSGLLGFAAQAVILGALRLAMHASPHRVGPGSK
ncbi:MAG TPA: hypothetical protein VHV79_10685 [Mycobacteriales bacterium]|jgi:hypothetical protein|nr:hypothetical protein [Mycobacteriales bacterium]